MAEITEVDIRLIHRLHVLLAVINCDYPVDKDKLKKYGEETAELWIQLYKWCYMPCTIHQLCFHAWESLELTELPLSFLSEQSLESANKTFKDDRLHHARKTSRLDTITDQFNRQTERSDLKIALAMMEHRGSKKKQDLPDDAIMLLKINTIDDEDDDTTVEDAQEPAEEPVILPAGQSDASMEPSQDWLDTIA